MTHLSSSLTHSHSDTLLSSSFTYSDSDTLLSSFLTYSDSDTSVILSHPNTYSNALTPIQPCHAHLPDIIGQYPQHSPYLLSQTAVAVEEGEGGEDCLVQQ